MRNIATKQDGFTLLEFGIVLAIFSYLVILSIPIINAINKEAQSGAVTRTLITLANAAYAHYGDESETWFESWPGNVGTLTTRGYLPVFNNVAPGGERYEVRLAGRGLEISIDLQNLELAQRVRGDWGSAATIDDTRLTIGLPPPLEASQHTHLIARDGSVDVFGDLNFRAGLADIDMHGNEIRNVRRITVQNNGTGLVQSDVVVTNALDARVFRYD